jgi:hypothetical protein
MSVLIFVIKGIGYVLAGLFASALIITICVFVFQVSSLLIRWSVDTFREIWSEFIEWARPSKK